MSGPQDKEKDIDPHFGVDTTGHEWDGIKELNNPLPKWWLITFYATVIWGIGFTIFYPAWPLITTNTQGVLEYSTREAHATTLDEARAAQAPFTDRIAALSIEEVAADAELVSFSRAGGAAAFRTWCSQCHGSGAAGGVGYPNLLDDEWIWGGSLEELAYTITHGIRQTGEDGFTTADTRDNIMSAFGRDGILTDAEIDQVVEHVLAISGQQHDGAQAEAGGVIFAEQCSACHGEEGLGEPALGAPNLTNAIWLYGGDRETIRHSVWAGRAGMMPAWDTRLSDATIKQLAIYVHSLGGGQ